MGLDEGTNIDGGEEAGELDEGDDEVDGSEDDVKDLHARGFCCSDGRWMMGELEGRTLSRAELIRVSPSQKPVADSPPWSFRYLSCFTPHAAAQIHPQMVCQTG